MSRTYPLRLIKERESYSFRDVSKLLAVHIRTVQKWKKEGLKTIGKPSLVMGFELKRFLNIRRLERKCQLKENEFYCTKCKKAVKSLENKVQLKSTNRTIGKAHQKECLIRGICETCGTPVNRLSHEGKLLEIQISFQIIDKTEGM